MENKPDQERNDATQAQNRKEAAAYTSQPRDKVLKAHPHLAAAYAAEDRLRQVAQEARPVSPAVDNLIDGIIRQNIAGAIKRGVAPQVRDETAKALTLQVAYRNLDHVVGARALDANSKLNVSDEHRQLLVSVAERTVGTEKPTGIDPLRTARLLAQADFPRQENPFKDKALAAQYTAGHKDTFGASPARGPGAEFDR